MFSYKFKFKTLLLFTYRLKYKPSGFLPIHPITLTPNVSLEHKLAQYLPIEKYKFEKYLPID